MSVVFTCLVYIAAQYKGISNVYIGSVGHPALIVKQCCQFYLNVILMVCPSCISGNLVITRASGGRWRFDVKLEA